MDSKSKLNHKRTLQIFLYDSDGNDFSVILSLSKRGLGSLFWYFFDNGFDVYAVDEIKNKKYSFEHA